MSAVAERRTNQEISGKSPGQASVALGLDQMPRLQKPGMVMRVHKVLLGKLRRVASGRFARNNSGRACAQSERRPKPASRRRSWKREFRVVHAAETETHHGENDMDAHIAGVGTTPRRPSSELGTPRLRLPETPRDYSPRTPRFTPGSTPTRRRSLSQRSCSTCSHCSTVSAGSHTVDDDHCDCAPRPRPRARVGSEFLSASDAEEETNGTNRPHGWSPVISARRRDRRRSTGSSNGSCGVGGAHLTALSDTIAHNSYCSSDDDTVLETTNRTACGVGRPRGRVRSRARSLLAPSRGCGHKPSAVAEADADVNTEGESESESEVATGSDSGRDGRSVACPAAVCRIAVVRACDGRVLSAGSGCLLDPQVDPELCPSAAAVSLMHQSRARDETRSQFLVDEKGAGDRHSSMRLEHCRSSDTSCSPYWSLTSTAKDTATTATINGSTRSKNACSPTCRVRNAPLVLTAAHVVAPLAVAELGSNANAVATRVLIAPVCNTPVHDMPPWSYEAQLRPGMINRDTDLAVLHIVRAVATEPSSGLASRHSNGGPLSQAPAVSDDREPSSPPGRHRRPSAVRVIAQQSLCLKERGMAMNSPTWQTNQRKASGPLLDCARLSDTKSAATRYHLRELPMMQAGDPHALDLGDQISILGFPRGSLGTLTHARGTMDGWARSPNGHGTVMKTRACVAPGDSGAPAIDSTGRVVGVVSASSGDYSGAVDYLRPVNLAVNLIHAATLAAQEQGCAADCDVQLQPCSVPALNSREITPTMIDVSLHNKCSEPSVPTSGPKHEQAANGGVSCTRNKASVTPAQRGQPQPLSSARTGHSRVAQWRRRQHERAMAQATARAASTSM